MIVDSSAKCFLTCARVFYILKIMLWLCFFGLWSRMGVINLNIMKKVISALLIIFAISGCSSGVVNDNKVKIGVLTPLSGPVAAFGEEAKEILDKTLAKISWRYGYRTHIWRFSM